MSTERLEGIKIAICWFRGRGVFPSERDISTDDLADIILTEYNDAMEGSI